jgi:hypothetical protein
MAGLLEAELLHIEIEDIPVHPYFLDVIQHTRRASYLTAHQLSLESLAGSMGCVSVVVFAP